MQTDLGLYVHIPFCASKCSYCAFYSFSADDDVYEEYVKNLITEIKKRGVPVVRPVKSLYIGGGTPTVLRAEQLCRIINACKESFNFSVDAEITVEANPADNLYDTFKDLKSVGVNRISLGVQSSDANELSVLCRRQNNEDVIRTVKDARKAGIDNISLDLMLGIPFQTKETLRKSMDFLLSQNPNHISAYILSLEEGTPLFGSEFLENIPNDDQTAELYEFMCSYLAKQGFSHYEISNFAKEGKISRHNSHYWKLGEYLGFGPAAHSFYEGKRFYCPSSISEFLYRPRYIDDGIGGTAEEYIMLGLRLKEGIKLSVLENKFSVNVKELCSKTECLQNQGLVIINGDNISLTEKGMLVSNSVINEVMI